MTKKKKVSPSQRQYMERFLAHVDEQRAQSACQVDVARILEGMQAEDEVARADAVRQICPCRMPWETFDRLRKAAQSLRNDPSPLVRANVLHIDEDAKVVASFEAKMAVIKEQEEEPRLRKRGKPWRQPSRKTTERSQQR